MEGQCRAICVRVSFYFEAFESSRSFFVFYYGPCPEPTSAMSFMQSSPSVTSTPEVKLLHSIHSIRFHTSRYMRHVVFGSEIEKPRAFGSRSKTPSSTRTTNKATMHGSLSVFVHINM